MANPPSENEAPSRLSRPNANIPKILDGMEVTNPMTETTLDRIENIALLLINVTCTRVEIGTPINALAMLNTFCTKSCLSSSFVNI